MSTRITTRANTLLGRILALAFVTLGLLYAGLYLATDGGINLKILGLLHSVSTPAMQDRQRELLQAISERFKKYDRVELLALYGVAILVGYMAAGTMGGVICSHRYRFLRAQGIVERQTMWLDLPAWALAWLVMTGLLLLALGTARWITIWLPVWLWLALAVPALLAGGVWVWRREWLSRRQVARRVTLPKLKWRVPLWAVVPGSAFLFVALVGVIAGWWALVPLKMPAWLLAGLLVPPVALVPGWFFLPATMRPMLFIPGRRRQVPFSHIRRVQVDSQPDGGTALVVTLHHGATWIVREGPIVPLQRLGGVLGRVVGLERQDLVTWA